MKQVLGAGITYHKYDARTVNSGRLVFDHSRCIIDSYDQITLQVREAYPKANTPPVGIPMSDQECKAADPTPDQPSDRKSIGLSMDSRILFSLGQTGFGVHTPPFCTHYDGPMMVIGIGIYEYMYVMLFVY